MANGLPDKAEILNKMAGEAVGDGESAAEAAPVEVADEPKAEEPKPEEKEEAPKLEDAAPVAGNQAKMVPLSELQGERKRRQELEAKSKSLEEKLAEFEKIKPDYDALKAFDSQIGAYLQANPKEAERLKAGLEGKLDQMEASTKDTAEQLNAQMQEFGEMDPKLAAVFQAQVKVMNDMQGRLDSFEAGQKQEKLSIQQATEQQNLIRGYEKEIAEIEKANPEYADDPEFMPMVLGQAQADNAKSLVEVANRIIARDKRLKEQTLKGLASKQPKKQGAAVETGGAPTGGPPPEQKPLGSEERLKSIVERYAAK